jgi:arabinose-5-phosphate isomerase
MKKKKVSGEDFGKNHPSGSIGLRFVKVGTLMRTKGDIPLVFEIDNMKKTLTEITKKGLGVTGVLNEKKELVGLVTDGDIRRNFESILVNTAKQTMTKNPVIIDENKSVSEALNIMNKKRITSLFIKKKNSDQPKGIIHIHDCIRVSKNAK